METKTYFEHLAKTTLETAILAPLITVGTLTGIYIFTDVVKPRLDARFNK